MGIDWPAGVGYRPGPMWLAMLHLLFLLSGISGLVYQTVWVRQFGNMFGNTVHSVSLVTAVFMLGLGVGALLAGRLADRRFGNRPEGLLRLYALLECGIGLLGFLLALGFHRLEFLSSILSWYAQDAAGWHHLSAVSLAARYLLAVMVLGPPTLLMGGTLTVLIRFLVASDLGGAGWRVGALYAVNTAGAALGCFLTDLTLIPALGLVGTQSAAALLNLAAGLGALRLCASARGNAARPHPQPHPPRGVERPTAHGPGTAGPESAHVPLVTAALFLAGFAGMGWEVVWFRFLSSVLGAQRSTFSLLLFVILTGIWLGSVAGGWASRRFGRPGLLFATFHGLAAMVAVISLACFDMSVKVASPLVPAYMQASEGARWLIQVWFELRAALLLAGGGAFFMGAAFPLANAMVQRSAGAVGSRAGILYLGNTAGAVLGSLCAGFLLLPSIGQQGTVLVVTLCSLGALACVWPAIGKEAGEGPAMQEREGETGGRGRGRPAHRLALVLPAGVAAAAVAWAALPSDHLLRKLYAPREERERGGANRILHMEEGLTESIAVSEVVTGDGPEDTYRVLYTDGVLMSGTLPGPSRYMRAFAHIPLLQVEAPETVLVICFGVGNTAHAALLHPTVTDVEVADLSGLVLESAEYFERWNGGILDDPRVHVFVNDGRQHLRMQPERRYDLVTLEPPPLTAAGVASLYSGEFYELARTRLVEGGFLTQWLPAYQVPAPVALSMVRAFVDVFPESVLVSGYRGHLILVGRNGGPPLISPLALLERLRARPDVWNDLKRHAMGSPTEIIGTFVAAAPVMFEATEGIPPLADDYPILEYAVLAPPFRETVFPAALLDPAGVAAWCPDCFGDGRPAPLVRHLDAYLRLLGGYYRSPAFRTFSAMRPQPSYAGPARLGPDEAAALRESPYLRHVFDRKP